MEQRNNPKSNEDSQCESPSKRPCLSSTCQPLALPPSHPYPSLWLVLNFRDINKAGGDRLIAALSLSRYQNLKQINLEFAHDIEDRHLEVLRSKSISSLQNLESLNLNGCRKISDKGIAAITNACPKLKVFSIYWNERYLKIWELHLHRS